MITEICNANMRAFFFVFFSVNYIILFELNNKFNCHGIMSEMAKVQWVIYYFILILIKEDRMSKRKMKLYMALYLSIGNRKKTAEFEMCSLGHVCLSCPLFLFVIWLSDTFKIIFFFTFPCICWTINLI